MRQWEKLLWNGMLGVLFAIATPSCSDDGDDFQGNICENGETQPCTCTDGSSGSQSCLPEEVGDGPCAGINRQGVENESFLH